MYLTNIFLLCFVFQMGEALEAIPAGKLPIDLSEVSAAYDGQDSVYVFGSNGPKPNYKIFKYNLASEITEEFVNFPVPLSKGVAATDGKDRIFYIGGWTQASSGIWDFTAEKPEPVFRKQFPHEIGFHGVGSDGNDSIYILGGYAASPVGASDRIMRYNMLNNSLEVVAHLPRPIFASATVWNGDSIWSFGGAEKNGTFTADVIQHQPSRKKTRIIPNKLASALAYSAAVAAKEDVYIIGGISYNTPNILSKFNTLTETIEHIEVPNLPIYLMQPGATFIEKTNRIYLFGGRDNDAPTKNIWYIQI